MRRKRSGETDQNTAAGAAIPVEEVVKCSVKIAETARWELSPDLNIDDREDQVLLLLSFLAWSSYVMIDWSVWTNSPRNSPDEEIRRARDRYLVPVHFLEWIPRQIDLLVWEGHLEPGERGLARAELEKSSREVLGLPLLPATDQENSIFGRIVQKLGEECDLNAADLHTVQHKMYVVMDEIQRRELVRL